LSISKRFVEMHKGKMWLESEVEVGTTIYFSLPLDASIATILAREDPTRWINPYRQYEPRTRRSKAPAPRPVPRFVLMEKGKTLQRLFRRYMGDFEVISVQDIEEAVQELSRSPAQALIVNTPLLEEMPASMGQLTNLPYDTPTVTCWVPGEDKETQQFGVVRYLIKPVTREVLLSTLESCGEEIESILLVDDKPEVLQLFARMLSSAEHSYRVLRATSGRQALSMMRKRQPDIVMLDLIMPGVDGFQVLREKSQDPSIQEIPVIVISAKDPAGETIASDTLTVTHSGGLSVRDLLACIQAVSGILSPSAPLVDREQRENPAA
jgi:CheY-like chemotaxis protein